MFKDITFNPHDKIKAGVDNLANVVKSTLGPGGNNVILQRGHVYHITKDGATRLTTLPHDPSDIG